MTAYQAAADDFIREVGCGPMDVLRSPQRHPFTVLMRARYLDAWDLWLFSQGEEEIQDG